MIRMNEKMTGFFCVVSAAALWGCMGIFVRGMEQYGLSSMDMVLVRALVTGVLMFLYLFLFKREELKIRWKDIWCFLGTGLASVVFFNFCYFTTIIETSLAVAATLLYTAPAFVVILSFLFFREKLGSKKILSVLLAFAGCSLVTGIFQETPALSTKGLLIGLGAGIGYALYSIFSCLALQRGYSSYTITFYTFLIAFAGCVPFCNIGEIGAGLSSSPASVPFAIFWAAVTTVAPYLLYTKGLSEMEAGRASVLANIEPVVASVLGVLLYKEEIQLTTLAGIVLVLVAAWVVTIPDRKTE